MDAARLELKLHQAQTVGNIQEVVETLSVQDKKQAMVIASSKGLCEVVVYLLEHGADIHYVDSHQSNRLHLLLYSYSKYDKTDRRDLLLQCVVKLVDNVVDVNRLKDVQDTPIFIAARRGLYKVVMYLLEQGVYPNYVDSHHNNLMHILLYNYDKYDKTDRRELLLQCVVILVDAGIDVNHLNDVKDTPISIATRKGFYEVVICLLEHGADVHYVDSHQNDLLCILLYEYARYDKSDSRDLVLQCVVKLVDAGVDVNQLKYNKATPIFIAARQGLYDVVMYLIEHGVDVYYVNSRQDNLLHILLYDYDSDDKTDLLLQCVVILVDAGVDVNHLNSVEDAPISISARRGLYEVVIYLLEHGADVHYVDNHQDNLMHIILYNYGKYDKTDRRDLLLQCVVILVEADVDVNQVNYDKHKPIFIAAREGLYEVVIYLLEHGADVHYVDGFKRSILYYVLGYSHSYVEFEDKCTQLVNTLIETGLDINQPDYEGNTPLFYVVLYRSSNRNDWDEIQLKLQTGQDICVPLHFKLINILLEAGCNANHQNAERQTALMHHIKHQNDISILKLLIPHSDLSLTDENGNTAISYCVQYYMFNSTPVFKLLVDSDSDLMSRNNGFKLFHDILKCKRLGVFRYYIRLKLIVIGVTAEGENMLHLLAGVNYDYSVSKFKWLLNNELDINHLCSKANTPTMIAAFLLNSKYLELLTRHPRLDINTQNKQGYTALHLCIIGFTMFKDGLNKRQVNDVVKNYCRDIYPIYMACIDILLCVDGIDVNIQGNGGRTSLMMAAMKNDRVLTRKLLQAGAIVTMLDHSGRSALQYLNMYQSVFDLTCFKLLLSNGSTGLLNVPCIDGNTIIQTALCFPFFWKPYHVVCFIRYLVAENCCLQILVPSSLESSYNQIDLTELNHQERDGLRKLLYLCGAEGEEIMTTLNFDKEDQRYERTDIIHSRDRAEFVSFCSNISLKSLCRRSIRQNLELGIEDKVKDLELPRELRVFLLLNDILHPKDYNIDNIDDGCNDFEDEDDYDGYDIDEDRDDDYSQYNYQYFTLNTDHELRQDSLINNLFPNGRRLYDDDDDDDDDVHGDGVHEDDGDDGVHGDGNDGVHDDDDDDDDDGDSNDDDDDVHDDDDDVHDDDDNVHDDDDVHHDDDVHGDDDGDDGVHGDLDM
ncbi:ankyrin repeat domain-containing protein 50 [Patella vulgata]|uniref:ankyrin repeat domain-containing protein 50 n=1 Tax=Patella vulgata TaxID=6465 RepID=UPI0021805A76|nr:ankyrin repeat domain-containing protein 50 [Patella vulgata]XP_050405280.1 ankyrin repeat domain-containing protein 50 [Patella vulgata]